MSTRSSFLARLGRHVRILLPMGLGVGALVGYVFADVPFGVAAGAGLGLLLSAGFALHAT